MFKKLLSLLLACIFAFGVFGTAVFAEEESTEPAAPGATHKLSEIAAAYEADETYLIEPGDTLELDGAASEILIVDYLTDYSDGSKSVSAGGYTFFRDNNQRTGYAFKGIGEKTTYANIADNADRAIDFTNPYDYAFAGWKVTYVYTESNFNMIKLTATWEIPPLEGWSGFLAMMRAYLKGFVDYLFAYLADLSNKIVEYLG